MKLFEARDLVPALLWAAAGGQALHLHRHGIGRRSPAPFARAVAAGEHIAHLFDWNAVRLEKTARACYVRRVYMQDVGKPSQHVDLCGQALQRARRFCTAGEDWCGPLAVHWLAAERKRPTHATMHPVLKKLAAWDGAVPRTVSMFVAAARVDDTAHALPPVLMAVLGGPVPVGPRAGVIRDAHGTPTTVVYRNRDEATAAVGVALTWLGPADLRQTAGGYDDRGAAAGLKYTVEEYTDRVRRAFLVAEDRSIAWVARYVADQGSGAAGGVPEAVAP